MAHSKINEADLNSPCRELSNGGLGTVVARSGFFMNYFFVCFYWGSTPAAGLIQHLSANTMHKVTVTDKNYGLATANTCDITKSCIGYRLSRTRVKNRLSKRKAKGLMTGVERLHNKICY